MIRLAENVPEVDLILGGHDHVYEKKKVNGTFILKSGTDFRQFSKVTLDFNESPVSVNIEAVDVTKSYEPNVELDAVLEKYTSCVGGRGAGLEGPGRHRLGRRQAGLQLREAHDGDRSAQ